MQKGFEVNLNFVAMNGMKSCEGLLKYLYIFRNHKHKTCYPLLILMFDIYTAKYYQLGPPH